MALLLAGRDQLNAAPDAKVTCKTLSGRLCGTHYGRPAVWVMHPSRYMRRATRWSNFDLFGGEASPNHTNYSNLRYVGLRVNTESKRDAGGDPERAEERKLPRGQPDPSTALLGNRIEGLLEVAVRKRLGSWDRLFACGRLVRPQLDRSLAPLPSRPV